MSVLIAIPARYASTRYPGKPLVALEGASGESKSLIQRSWEAAMFVPGVSRVVVATDDDRIESSAKSFGAEVIMTSSECKNGTERCAESLEQLDEDVEIIVNLQGDAPLTPSWFIEDLVAGLIEELDQIETDTDAKQADLRAALFEIEKTLDPIDAMFLYEVIELTGEIADMAERVGRRLELLLSQ